jgi:hypothetical protein
MKLSVFSLTDVNYFYKINESTFQKKLTPVIYSMTVSIEILVYCW